MSVPLGVLVTCERRFKQTPDGIVWTTSTDDCEFWRRYLGPFSAVTVLSRAERACDAHPSWRPVSGPGVQVTALPCFVGPVQFLARLPEIRRACEGALRGIQAVILRTPGNTALAMHKILQRDGRPYGVEVTGDPFECYAPGAIRHPLRPFFRMVFTALLKQQCAGAAVAAYVTQAKLQRRYPASPETWTTHYSSVSLPGAAFAPGPREQGAVGRPLRLISVGSMEQPYKGFDALIRATRLCRDQGLDLHLTLVGTGKHRGELEAQARRLAIPARFTGELPGPSAVRGELAGADIFVLPSWTEGLPRVIIEAMAQALPCIGTTVGGTTELLERDEVVPPGDEAALASTIARVASSARLRHEMSVRNLSKSAEYADNRLAARRREMYLRLKAATLEHFEKDDEDTLAAPHYFVLAEGVLGLRTNVPGFTWPFGMSAPGATKPQYEGCKLRLTLASRPRGWLRSRAQAVASSPLAGKYHYFSGLPGGSEVVYHRRILPGCELLLRARRLASDNPVIEVNRAYLRLVHYRFMNLHSAGYVLSDLAALLLLRAGLAPVHCSSVKLGGKVIVVFAPSNTGKTLTAITLCREHGAKFLAEDLAITDGLVVHAVPWTSTFRFYAEDLGSPGLRLRRRIERLFPVVELLPSALWQRVTDIVGESGIAASGQATDVVVLEQGPEGVEPASVEAISQRIINLNRAEFNYTRALLNNAYGYFNPGLDIEAAVATEAEVLRRLAGAARNRWIVRATRANRFPRLILSALGE